MSFFDIFTNSVGNGFTKYKGESEVDYKEFMKFIEIGLGSVDPKNFEKMELMELVSNLLNTALRYKPKERPIIKDIIRKMKEFEKKTKYTLNYSKTELEHNKKLLIYIDDVDNSLSKLLNKKKDKVEHIEEVKAKNEVKKKEVKVKDKEEVKNKSEVMNSVPNSSMSLTNKEESIIRELPPTPNLEIMKHMEVIKKQEVVWNKTHFIIALESGSNS